MLLITSCLQCCTHGDAIKIQSSSQSPIHIQNAFSFRSLPSTQMTPGGCRKLAPVFHRDLLPSVLCRLQRCKKTPRKLLVNHTFLLLWATLCRWESNPHNPKCPLQSHAWVRDLAAETVQVFLNWQSSSLEQTCHHQCPELIMWMVTSMGRLGWGHPSHSISGIRTISTGQRGGQAWWHL